MRLIIRRPRPLSKASTGALALPKLGAPTREWEQDGYRCRYFSRDDGMGVVTVDGPNMPLPWHEVADSEGKARALVKSAIPKLRAGKSPSAGVFKPLAKARPRKPPGQGRTARAATTAAPQPEAKPKGTRTRAPRKVDHAATARDALTASRVADDRYQAAVRETRRSDPRADISAHAHLQHEGRRQMHIHHAATHRMKAEQEPARARQHLAAADAHDRAERAHLSGGDDATRASTSAAAYKASDAAHGRMTKARLMVKARRGAHNRLPTDVEKKDKRGRTYYGPPDKPKKQKPRGRPEVDPEAATVKLEEPKLHRHPWVAEHELRNRIREHVARHDRARSLADSAHAEGDHEEADHWDGVADEHHHAARLLQLAGQHRSRGRDVEAIEHLQAGLRQSRAANKAGVPMVKGRRLGVLLKGKKRAGQPGYTKSKDRRGRTIWVRESDTTGGPAKPQYPRPEHPPGSPPVPPGGVRPGLTDEEHADLGKHIPHMHERIAEHDTLSRYAFAQAEKAKTTTDRTAWTARAFQHHVAKGHLQDAIRHHERRYGSTKERVPAALEASDAAMGDETKAAYEASLPQRAKRAALKVRDLGERVGKRVGLIKGRRLVVRMSKAKVREHQRRLKDGRTITVAAHERGEGTKGAAPSARAFLQIEHNKARAAHLDAKAQLKAREEHIHAWDHDPKREYVVTQKAKGEEEVGERVVKTRAEMTPDEEAYRQKWVDDMKAELPRLRSQGVEFTHKRLMEVADKIHASLPKHLRQHMTAEEVRAHVQRHTDRGVEGSHDSDDIVNSIHKEAHRRHRAADPGAHHREQIAKLEKRLAGHRERLKQLDPMAKGRRRRRLVVRLAKSRHDYRYTRLRPGAEWEPVAPSQRKRGMMPGWRRKRGGEMPQVNVAHELTTALQQAFPHWGGHEEIAAQVLAGRGSAYDNVRDAMVDAGARDIMPPDDFDRLTSHVGSAVHAMTTGDVQGSNAAMAHAGRIVARWSASEDLFGLPVRGVEIQSFRRGSGSEVTPFADVVVTLSRPATAEDADHIERWVRRVQRWRDGATSHVHGDTITVNVEADTDDVDALRDAAGRDSSVQPTVTAGEDDINDWDEGYDPDDAVAKLVREEQASRPVSARTRAQRVGAVANYLGFHDRSEAEALAERIIAHGGPVWAATDLDIDEQAERAARAWLRHNITEYDAGLDDARQMGMHRDDYYADDKRDAMQAVNDFLRRKRGQ